MNNGFGDSQSVCQACLAKRLALGGGDVFLSAWLIFGQHPSRSKCVQLLPSLPLALLHCFDQLHQQKWRKISQTPNFPDQQHRGGVQGGGPSDDAMGDAAAAALGEDVRGERIGCEGKI